MIVIKHSISSTPNIRRQAEGNTLSREGPRAIIMLDGSVKNSSLSQACGRSILDLPVDHRRTILHLWQDEITAFNKDRDGQPLSVYLLANPRSAKPSISRINSSTFEIIEDRTEYRGTGGAVADASRRFENNDDLLIVAGPHMLVQPLSFLIRVLSKHKDSCCIMVHDGNRPSGLILAKAGLFRKAPTEGYLDLKEQFLPAIADDESIRAVRVQGTVTIPLRTVEDYLEVIKIHSRRSGLSKEYKNEIEEDHQSIFKIVEPQAVVANNVIIHNSVIQSGARVDHGAAIIDSLICTGAWIKQGQIVRNQLMTRLGRTDS